MKKFKINDKYSIEQYDTRNWVIMRKKDINLEKRNKTSPGGLQHANTAIYGHYRTLQDAKEDLVELVAKEVGSYKELDKWVDKIKEI